LSSASPNGSPAAANGSFPSSASGPRRLFRHGRGTGPGPDHRPSVRRGGALRACGDAMTLLEPDDHGISTLAYIRRVPGVNLWVWYRLDKRGAAVELVRLTNVPP